MKNNEIIKYKAGLVKHVGNVVKITNRLLSKDFYKEVLVENMVKDAMDEGFDNVKDLQDALTSGLGIDSPDFRKHIEDAFNRINGGKGGDVN